MNRPNKVDTAILPTPLHKLENISKDLNINLYIKRDDLTGFGIGGNKLRKLNYLVKKAIDEGCTTLLTYGGPQTNHGRLTATAAAKFNMKSIIMVYGKKEEKLSGNLVLDKLLGSEVVFMDTTSIKEKAKDLEMKEVLLMYRELREKATNETIKRYEENGEKVFVIAMGGHSKEGMFGYIDCSEEIHTQSKDLGISFDYVITGNGTGGTVGGLLLGKELYNETYEIHAINVSNKKPDEMERTISFCNAVSKDYDLGVTLTNEDLKYTNDYVGIDYNVPDKDTREAIYYLASKEGIFTDPCYTGKSFRGLLEMVKNGAIKKNSNVLYIHTGGTPGIWTDIHEEAFNDELWNDIIVYN